MSALAHPTRKEIALLLLLLALFLFFSTLAVIFIRSEMRLNRLVAEYRADKTATALLERTMNEAVLFDMARAQFGPALEEEGFSPYGEALGQELLSELPASVRGFGLYRNDGVPLIKVLAAPTALESPRGPGGEDFQFRAGPESIVLVRRIGILPHPAVGEMPLRGMGRMMGTPPELLHRFGRGPANRFNLIRPAYLYLDLALPSYFRERSLLNGALVGVPLLIAAILVTIGLLVGRNRQYRERIEAQRQLVHLGEIARTLSHEIKNPLSAIKLQTAILKRTIGAQGGAGAAGVEPAVDAGPPDAVRSAPTGSTAGSAASAPRAAASPLAAPREIVLIEEETERLSRLVERIGEYLRDPRGNPERIDLYQFTMELLARFPWPVRRPELPAEPLAVRFDPDRLRSVLENLVKNGVESAQGGEAGESPPIPGAAAPVAVSLEATKGKVELIVADRGAGLSEEDAARLFDPFFTTKVRGMGVGLAISKRFVEAAGGTLLLRPARAGGAEAVVTLPRYHQ